MTRPFPDEEPSATHREAASNLRQLFVSLVQSGFTEAQALTIIGNAVAAAIQAQGGGPTES